MKKVNIPRVVIAATQSSSGKTTVVTGILRALKNKGMKVQPFKVGPDYIDPSYHGMASGRAGHNLDTWLVDESRINDLFAEEAGGADIAVIEGVMGLYDGGKNGISSTAQLAKKLQAPVILVINVQSMGDSAAAIALGFKLYDEDVNLAGVILNRLGSPTHKALIEEAMAKINVPVFGAIYRDDSVHMPERHLGLTPAQENNAKEVIEIISAKIAKEVYLDKIVELAHTAPPLYVQENKQINAAEDVVIAVAQDKAFSFYYPASLKQLSACGAKIEFFSPLEDEAVPSNACALIFGGGSPDTSASEDLSGVQFVNGTRPGNTALVDLAKQQVGNVGGYPYWSWYGFNSRVEWCACFVSWCYNQAGVSEPKFAACQSQGVPWFQSRGQWGARGYENIAPGDAIFFDWDLDGSADHVGIVIGTDGSRVYTVEGNSGDACKIKSYDLNYQCIKGYGLMNW